MTVAFLVTASPGSVNFAAISDPSFKATQLGFGLGAYLIILFATISTNAGNIYASALGITNIATRWKTSMRRLLLVSSAIVVPLALLPLFETNFVFTYIFFLDFLGAIVVPLWTLTLVDYFLVKARRYTDDLFASEGGALLVPRRVELARRRHAPRRDRAVLDHRVRLPGLAGDDLGGVADDRLRGRRVLLLGSVGLAEAPPRSPGDATR